MSKRRAALIAMLVIIGSVFTPLRAEALELTRGRLKLVLHERIGRFSLYYMSDIRDQTFVPLFLVQDPRTSSLSILDGNRAYRLGDASQFTETVTETVNGGRFTWESTSLTIIQDFEFVTSMAASLADAVVVRLSVTNMSEQRTTIGARYIFDTELAEDTGIHFQTASATEYTREAEVEPSESIRYWRSPSTDLEGVGFQQTVFGSGVTVPTRVVFANWKRLNESSWDYEVERRRNFNLLPYSINDSAAAIYYDPVSLGPGETREIISIFGNVSSGAYTLRTDTGISRVFQSVITEQSAGETESSVRADLLAVQDLIEQIDSLLANPETVSRDDVEVLRGIVDQLKERRADYE